MDITNESKATTNADPSSVLCNAQNVSGLNISVCVETNIASIGITSGSNLLHFSHPLVLLNISDHYTRIKVQNPGLNAQGVLTFSLFNISLNRDLPYSHFFILSQRRSLAVCLQLSQAEKSTL